MRNWKRRQDNGFTLPELLVVAAVVLGFVAAMLVLIRPADYEAEHNRARRQLDLASIMQALAKYERTEQRLPVSLPAEETAIATQDDGSPTLCDDLVPKYIADLPYDPTAGIKLDEQNTCAGFDQIFLTGYTVQANGGRVVLRAPASEKDENISVERWFPLF